MFLPKKSKSPKEVPLVIIPTYNEKENIALLIKAIFNLKNAFHIIIVDDSSPDQTANEVIRLQNEYPNKLHLVVRKAKLGLGSAYMEAFHFAIKNHYKYVLQMDADFSHDPIDLPRLHSNCKYGYDVIIGSRYIDGVTVINWPMKRLILSYFANYMVRVITGMKLKDTTTGFNCYNHKVIKKILLHKAQLTGYGFQVGVKLLAWHYGFKLKEISILFKDRVRGYSKLSHKIIFQAFWEILKLRIALWVKKCLYKK